MLDIDSKLVQGVSVSVGICPQLSLNSVSMILGNDLPGKLCVKWLEMDQPIQEVERLSQSAVSYSYKKKIKVMQFWTLVG